VFEEGTRSSVKGMRVHVLPNGGAATRAVFVTVRAYGNAVQRNRARRVVSECWRLLKHRVNPGFDVVFVVYPGNDAHEERGHQMETLVRRSGLAETSKWDAF